jgi:pimeloyl-ACP methyl ester carboxylesterase
VAGAYDPQVSITGTGRPLVLVSGMDGTGQLFYTQVPRLARSFRVATYQLRDAATDMTTLVDDLAGVIALVSPAGEPVVLLGESFGGALSMSLALARPELVAALVILNSFPAFLPQIRLHLARAALRAMPWGMMAVVRRTTAFRLHSRHTTREELQRFRELMRTTTREGYLNRLAVLMRYDVRDELAGLRVPTLFLAADGDRLVPAVAQAQYMAARVPGASMRVLEGHGHICLLAPDLDVSRLLDEWEALGASPAARPDPGSGGRGR